MRMRLRGPEGTSTITLPDDAQVRDLISEIISQTSISDFDVKYGYPPQPLLLSQSDPSLPLSQLDVKLNNEQLTVSARDSPSSARAAAPPPPSSIPVDVASKRQEGPTKAGEPTYSFAGIGGSSSKPAGPVALKRKGMDGDVPEVSLPDRGATLGEIYFFARFAILFLDITDRPTDRPTQTCVKATLTFLSYPLLEIPSSSPP